MDFDPKAYLERTSRSSSPETEDQAQPETTPVQKEKGAFDPVAYLQRTSSGTSSTFDPASYLKRKEAEDVAAKMPVEKPMGSLLSGTTLPKDAPPMGNRMIEEVGVAPLPILKDLPKFDASKMSTAEERAKASFGLTPEMDATDKALRTLKSGAYAASTGLQQTWLGGARLISDLTGVNKEKIKSTSKQLEKETGAVSETFQDNYGLNIARNVGASVIQNVPLIGVGLMAGAPTVYSAIFGQSFLQSYDDSRNEGLDVGASTARSALYGTAEVIGERLGLPDLLKGFKDAAKGVPTADIAKQFAKYMLKELPGEQLTYVMQFLTDKGFGLNPEAGLEQFAQGAIDTALVTFGQTAVIGGVGVGSNQILKSLRKYHSEGADKDLETFKEIIKGNAPIPSKEAPEAAPEAAPKAPVVTDVPQSLEEFTARAKADGMDVNDPEVMSDLKAFWAENQDRFLAKATELPETRVNPNVEEVVAPEQQAPVVAPQVNPELAAELSGIKTAPIRTPQTAVPTQAQTFENIERPQAQTPEFKQWFGESKVAAEPGKPIPVYHITKNDGFDEFLPEYKTDLSSMGFHFGTEEQANFRGTQYDFEGQKPNVGEYYLSIKNPLEVSHMASFAPDHLADQMMDLDLLTEDKYEKLQNKHNYQSVPLGNELVKILKKAGYDGLSYENDREGEGKSYVPFDPNQIKSSTRNTGAFSPASNKVTENLERLSTMRPFMTEPAARTPSFKGQVKKTAKLYEKGYLTPEDFTAATLEELKKPKTAKEEAELKRGQNHIISRIRQEVDRKRLDPKVAEFAEWFIKQNPALVDDLGISIVQRPEGSSASGQYESFDRLMTLFKDSGNSETVVHEILHHLERMLPTDIQNAIRKSWQDHLLKAGKAAEKSDDKNLKSYYKNLLDYHLNGSEEALTKVKDLLRNGKVDYDAYQFLNPSEFWAVNATNIMDGRYEASQSLVQRIKQWLREFAQKAKSIFGLNSDAPILKALKSLEKSDGKFSSTEMLGSGSQFENVERQRKNYKGNPASLATWAQEADAGVLNDTFIYKMQDKLIDVKRTLEAIKKQVGEVSTRWDTYKREILYHGRASDAIKKFLRYDIQKMVESIGEAGLTMPQVKEYLHMRHAQERNESVAKINPSMPDAGSGIETAVAQKYLKSLPKETRQKLEAIGKKVDQIILNTQQILVETGQETQETIDSWNKAYKHYVPLFREDLDYVNTGAKGTGQGFSIRGAFTRRAMGSEKPVQDILTNVVEGYERAVGRGEKNLVLQSLYGLAIQNPNPDLWMPINPDAPSSTKQAKLELARFGISPTDVDNLMREPLESYIDPKTGLVGQRLKQSIRDSNYALPLRIEGKQRFLILNPNNPEAVRMVESLKNMDLRDLHAAITFFGKFTRYFVAINTQYNPVFGIVNFYRDIQGTAINLSSTPLAGKKIEVMKRAVANLPGVWSALRAETRGEVSNDPVAKDFIDMQAHGGQTGYRDSYQQKREQHKIIEDTLAKIEAGPIRKAANGVFQLMSDFNDTMENATRLALYQTAIKYKIGKTTEETKDEAAILAKTTSVNFNKRGAWTQEASALYGFFNPAIQGNARIMETMLTRDPTTGKNKFSSAGRKILTYGLGIGSVQALMLAAAGFDDDQPPAFVRDKNIVVPLPGTDKKYLTFPMPLGFNVIPGIGRIATELALSGGKNAGKKLSHAFFLIVDSFNPLGGSESFAQMISPTFADPIIALAENKDAFGRPIYKKDRDTAPTPGHTRARDTASEFSKITSKFFNTITGGNEDKKGLFSPTPDQIDYVIGQLTGGVGRELMKVEQSTKAAVTGEALPAYKIPLVGRFYGDAAGEAAQSAKFYERVTSLSEYEKQLKGKRDRNESTADLVKNNPEGYLWQRANRIENEISALNKRKRELISKNAPAAQIKQIEELKRRKMEAFNKDYERAKK
jgi:hypothetical protein